MIKIFYRLGDEIMLSRSQTEFATISKENVLWIDILEPTGEEKRATEIFLGTEIQSRDQTEEIESSSRFSEDEMGIYANTYFLSPTGDEMSSDPVSFIITDHTLTTLRDIPLRSFEQLHDVSVKVHPLLHYLKEKGETVREHLRPGLDLHLKQVERTQRYVPEGCQGMVRYYE